MSESIFHTKEITTNEDLILIACVGLDDESFQKITDTFFPREGYGILRLDSMEQVDHNSFGIPEAIVVLDDYDVTVNDDRILTVTNKDIEHGGNSLSISEQTKDTKKDRNGNVINVRYLDAAVDVISDSALNRRRKKLYAERINDIKEVLNGENGIDIDRLLELFASKDATALGHIKMVAKLTDIMSLGMEISNETDALTDQEKNDFRTIAFIHDIGKLVTPDQLLKNQGAFVGYEYSRMKEHVLLNYELAEAEKTQELLSLALKHHYTFDGKNGYLEQKESEVGEKIPIMARMMAVIDAFDAITDTSRIYQNNKLGESVIEKAINIMYNNSGTQFDPKFAHAFLLGFQTRFENDENFRNEWLDREHMSESDEERKTRSESIKKALDTNLDKFYANYGFENPIKGNKEQNNSELGTIDTDDQIRGSRR